MASIDKRTRLLGDVVYVVRYRDLTGASRSKSFSTHIDAVRFSNKVEVELAEGTFLDPRRGRETFASFHKKWARARESKVQESRRDTEASQARVHIIPRWGEVPLNKIGPLAIETWIGKLQSIDRQRRTPGRQPVVSYRDASPTTKEMVLLQFKMCLDAAVREGILRTNPAAQVKPPSRARKRVTTDDVLDVHELDQLVKATPKEWKALVVVSAWLGLRWSEALGLRWRDVDLDKGLLYVANETIVESSGTLYEHIGGKTPAATRTVPLPARVVVVLGWHRSRSEVDPKGERRVFLTLPCPSPGRHSVVGRKGGCKVVGQCHGHSPQRSAFRRIFVKAVAEAGLDGRSINVRQLRHTAATLMLAGGLDVLEVQARLGHSRGSITLDTYGRVLAGRRVASTELLNAAMASSDLSFADDTEAG